ncbi:MAG: hypothetical protein ACPG21_13810 [Crocinitomicaceae bacterium]
MEKTTQSTNTRHYFLPLFIGLLTVFLSACVGGGKTIDITPEEIDAYVAEKLDVNQLYDVSQSPRFSKEKETYEVIEYLQDDSVVLFVITHVLENEQIDRQVFFKHGVPVYVDELVSSNIAELPFTQRRIYLDGANALKAEERSSAFEDELQYLEYQEVSVDLDNYDFEKPKRAFSQEGEFALFFEEFINIPPQEYLILENEESGYDVALFIAEGDDHPFLLQLKEDPEKYKGRPVFVTQQFIIMTNIERMLFIDGYFKDESSEQSEEVSAQ